MASTSALFLENGMKFGRQLANLIDHHNHSDIHSIASTSSSSIRKSFKYDVFLSFRGEDTRKNFVDHLYHALHQRGINTYKDDEEIKKGKRISDELIRSIEDSKFYIIVFSKNYASSSWCLDELVKIMECQKMSEHTAYPIFYDVEPTEVRNQSGAVGEAFAKHVNGRALKRWRDAMKEATCLAGWELKNTFGGHQARFIQKVVEEISLELRFMNMRFDDKLIGMEGRVKDVVSSLEIDIDDVRLIGIKGMGGAGKTTLAKAVFDQISFQFEGSSFVKNVRESSERSGWDLKPLQKQILSDVLHDPNIIVKGDSDLKNMMCGRKVLLVLDDVDHINQLEALAGELNWFKQGSRIIITTREEQVLVAHGVPKNLILDVNLLSQKEATCLFNKYAFGRVIPNQGYDMLSNQIVSYAAGLPLTIKVLGSFLRGKDELEWTDALERLKTIPLRETLEILEISYKSLEEDYKEIFLDVACFLKGWKKEDAITALESCGFHARNGLKVLEQKSLITISDSGCLSMHDHIEELGKNIIRRLHPNEPSRHSRLWNQDEIEDILVEDKGTEATRCIEVWRINPDIVMKGLRKMSKLRFLIYDGISYYNDIGVNRLFLPNSLQYLRWDGYPSTPLHINFQANNLVGLKMSFGSISQLWKKKERKVLKKLRFIDLSSYDLRYFDIGLIPNLEKLSLVNCNKLVELHVPVKSLKLKHLTLRCSMLETLNITRYHNLEMLHLECEDLVELHLPVKKLKHLWLLCSKMKTLNITRCHNLETLHLECDNLVELHLPVEKLEHLRLICSKMKTLNLMENLNLKKLGLLSCDDLLELYMPVENSKLKKIKVRGSKLTLNLATCQNLERLKLEQCEDLVELHMPTKSLNLVTVNICCFNVRALNLTRYWNLEMLELQQCKDLVELHMPIESPNLKTISIPRSKLRNLNLTRLQNLEWLGLEECEDLVELRMPVESPNLKTISIRRSKLKILNLIGTRNIESLDLEKCEDLEELHMPIESPFLKIIKIPRSKLRTLNLTGTRNLERLHLEHCAHLVELHMPIESPELKTIDVRCSKLRTLNLSGTLNLERLDLEKCENLVEVHMPFETLNLKTINIPCSKDLEELHMPIECSNLKTVSIPHSKLRILNLTGTWNLERLDLQYDYLVELHMPIESSNLRTFSIPRSKLRTLNLTGFWKLEKLCLQECEDLVEIHMPTESPELKSITIHCSKLRTLNLTGSWNLEKLDLGLCEDLVELYMPTELPRLKSIIIHCSKLRTLHLGLSPSLERLDLHDCFNLVEIYAPVGCLSGCVRFKPFLINQGLPMVGSFDDLHLIARSLSICSLHPEDNFPKFHFECIYKELLLSSTRNLAELITNFGICACTNLASLSGIICGLKHLRRLTLEGSIPVVPKELDKLECLEQLTLLSTNIEHLPESICMLKHLKVLRIKSCRFLKELPEDLGRLEGLEELCLMDCTSLRDIPNSICEMKLLECFHLTNCILVERLPKGMGRLKCLKTLNIQGTGINDMPESISQLEDLRFFL